MEKPCPMCNYVNGPMGSLGSLIWYRCRACGMEYNHQRGDDIASVKREHFTEPLPLYQDGAPVYDIDEACAFAEQEYGPDWEYVSIPDNIITRREWLCEPENTARDQ